MRPLSQFDGTGAGSIMSPVLSAALALTVLLPALAGAQAPPTRSSAETRAIARSAMAGDQPTRLLREPAVGGDNVAFMYANDIWVAPLAGGDARRMSTSCRSLAASRVA
jgi:hypothetical protein